MEFEKCIKQVQSYLQNSPLIVLGSGSSIPYGFPSMDDLANYIKENEYIKADPQSKSFFEELDLLGLEPAIDKADLSKETLQHIRNEVWGQVKKCDDNYFKNNFYNIAPEIAHLIQKVITPTPNKAVIVTTNYDRLAEYASDKVRATTVTGFEGSHIKNLEIPSSTTNTRRIRARERICEIWKVHGSLDWFVDANKSVYSVPHTHSIPKDLLPLIVPPGKDKYTHTHNEPFRSIIAEADKAFSQAKSFLCIGYGFNDDHI